MPRITNSIQPPQVMLAIFDTVSNSAAKRWEDARDLLESSMRDYLHSCVYLENSLGPRNRHIGTADIISRIESSLDLQYQMSQQLIQSIATLSRTRNRFSSSIWVLPEDVLSQIFLHVVYSPEIKALPMEQCVSTLYRNLHSLLGVCSNWRNIAISQVVLWELLPASEKSIKPESIDLSVKRSGGRGLNLALRLARPSFGTAPRVLKTVEDSASRLRVINIEVDYWREIKSVMERILRGDVPSQLSGLSIRHVQFQANTTRRRTPYVIEPRSSIYSKFTVLVKSLSTLRLDLFQLKWESTTFSDRLVELVVHRVKLGESDSSIASFVSAISSARELRDLQIIAVKIGCDQIDTTSPRVFPKFVLSKLRSLLLQDLSFSVLEFLLMAIAPGSYCTALGLTKDIVKDINPISTPNNTNIESLIGLLEFVKIDRLLLTDGCWLNNSWLEGSKLRNLLESVSGLKELIINGFTFDARFCNDVFPPQNIGARHNKNDFPSLELLTLTQAKIPDEHGFKRLLTNISTQKLILGGRTQVEEVTEEIKEGSAIAGWLNSNISVVRFVDPDYLPGEMTFHGWTIW
ncbi:unnamed protein product [Rhizoctonia solani]|uniref:F-box domain-containing protein n=1 Tax=Rhizoctonia solani TaxID=456999 RepID=A0A8H3GHZ0_9AGAM|nr:unnamed protein product [Rhizoctonia solani]